MSPGEARPAHHLENLTDEDRSRPSDYFNALESQPILLKRLFHEVHNRSRKYDRHAPSDLGQEALALVLAMKGPLRVGPCWSAKRTPEWYEDAASALRRLATSPAVMRRAWWRLYGEDRELPMQQFPEANNGEDRFEDESEAGRARLREEQMIGRASWASVKNAMDGAYATTKPRRQFLDVLRVLAMRDGNGPLLTGDTEAGGSDRPFRGGGKSNKTVQLNNRAVLSTLQSRFPDQGWTIEMVRDCSAALRAFMMRYRSAQSFVDTMGPPPIR